MLNYIKVRTMAIIVAFSSASVLASDDSKVAVESDITFARYGERTLELDLYLPDSEGQRTAIVLVHGGGWIKG